MPGPLLLEVNTRCWLNNLSDKAGRRITLARVPETEFRHWEKYRFTHVWLMGVWTTGAKSRAVAQAQPEFQRLCEEFFPGAGPENIVSSPYAIAEYAVDKEFGGNDELREFRQRLAEHGIKLMLDFVPNHVGLDHPWLTKRPELFVHGAQAAPETFHVNTKSGSRWIAHGKDPYFPAWIDTAQLDYRREQTRRAMVEVLQTVAGQCDGVRCDMAMLVLEDVFDNTWRHFHCPGARKGEFWAAAIRAIKEVFPDFLFLAEAYWNLEGKLQELGFDYTYDKLFYDHLVRREHGKLQHHLHSNGGNIRTARFLENHDEPRIASLLPIHEHTEAAALLLKQPGMRLIYDGQLEGSRLRTPVQLARFLPEKPDAEITRVYRKLMAKPAKSALGAS